jgi:PAS domain S-box-containing protein
MSKKYEILIVEDDIELLCSTKKIVESGGYYVHTAQTANAAKDLLEMVHIDLILLDVILPDINGLTFCKELKASENYADIPVIILSGNKITPDDEAEGIDAGAEDYLTRPISIKKLLARIRKSLSLFTALKEIKETAKYWHYTFSNTNDALMLLDKGFNVKIANKKMADFFGIPAEEMAGMKCWEIVHKTDNPIETCPSNQIQKSGNREEIILNLEKKWFKVSLDLIRDETGFEGYIHIISDITKQKNAEAKLRENEEHFKLAMDVTSDGIFDWNLKTNNIWFSPNYFKMLGYEYDELPHNYDTYRSLLHPDDAEISKRKVERYLSGTSDDNSIEMRFKHKDGRWVWILCRGKIVEFDENIKPLRFVGTHINITKRKKAEDDLRTYQENLENLIKERTDDLKQKNIELQLKNEELENFNDLFVGREFRINELKEKIKELKKEK